MAKDDRTLVMDTYFNQPAWIATFGKIDCQRNRCQTREGTRRRLKHRNNLTHLDCL